MKQNILFICLVSSTLLCFYITNKIVEYRKEQDPIMQEIKKQTSKYKIDPIDAQIIGNTIIPGKNGKTVDYEKTYQKMKEYGTYNESLTTIKEVIPTISIHDNYDKYIIEGNQKNRKITFVFPIPENKNINKLLSILEQKEVTVTFFIDGTIIENQLTMIKKHKNQEFNLLSYHNSYNESYFKTALAYLDSITQNKAKYCYTEKDNSSLLTLCKKLKLHTIKPTLKITKNLYATVKENIRNSIILSLEDNNYIEKELPMTIDYIRQKGYQIVSLDNLLKED